MGTDSLDMKRRAAGGTDAGLAQHTEVVWESGEAYVPRGMLRSSFGTQGSRTLERDIRFGIRVVQLLDSARCSYI